MNKREFLKGAVVFIPAAGVLGAVARHAAGKETAAKEPAAKQPAAAPNAKNGYEPSAHYYGMGIDIDKCIGCARCVVACKEENDVPADEHFEPESEEFLRELIAEDARRKVRRRKWGLVVDLRGSGLSRFLSTRRRAVFRKVAEKCYLPANRLIHELIVKNKGKFRVTYSLTGSVIDQFEKFAPEVIDSFKELANTGCVEFLAETYSHSLSSLISEDEFKEQVKLHDQKIFTLFGVKPTVFRNTELIYSDKIGAIVADMGYSAMLTEGAKHVLGWKSPNFLYTNALNPRLK